MKQHQLTVYIHPIPPVLDETRGIVLQFEAELKYAVHEAVQQDDSEQQGKLCYLDFTDQLLAEDGRFKDELHLDGTHLHPKYLKYLEAALSINSSTTSAV